MSHKRKELLTINIADRIQHLRKVKGISQEELADKEKGIAIQKYEIFNKIADSIFDGKAKEIYPQKEENDLMIFASAIKEVGRIYNVSN